MRGYRPIAALVLWALCACDPAATSPDAGPATDAAGVVDSGPVDAGAFDAGLIDVAPADTQDLSCQSQCVGQCFGQRCIPPRPRTCEQEGDCGEGEQCSVLGECFAGDCLGHGDCRPDQRCALGRCIGRVSPEEGVAFERVIVPGLNDHVSRMIPDDFRAAYGFGAALIDIDGDLDLDVFLGSQRTQNRGSPACIFRNDSVPGALRFHALEAHCQPRDGIAMGGFGLDLEGDGYHELLVAGPRLVELRRFHPQQEVINLLDSLPEGDPGRDCFANAALSVDLNLDGRSDLVVGCGSTEILFSHGEPHSMHRNLAFVQTEAGRLRPLTLVEWNPEGSLLLDAEALTHALGAADINHDGLIDLLVSEEGFLPASTMRFEGDAGGVYQRCAPGQACQFEPLRIGSGSSVYGSYMGSGLLQIEDRGEYLYFTDLGDNRLLRFNSGVAYDIAQRSGTNLEYFDAQLVFSWGVVVDDFDRDGRDDLFVSNGSLIYQLPDHFDAYYDAVFLQRDGVEFAMYSAEVGITPFSRSDSRHDSRVYSSRATLKSDLDADGFLDLLTVGMEGVPRLHREVPNQRPDPPRCNLVPVDRYVPGFGMGHAIIPDGDSRPRQWDSQGQHRSGASPFVVTPWTRGKLRFPSGFEVPYDCQGQPGPLVVNEPEWLVQSSEGQTLSVALADGSPSGALSAYCEPSGQTVAAAATQAQRWTLELPEGTQRYMLRLGERWLPRWWQR